MKDGNRCFASALRGPVIMITIGTLFLLDNIGTFKFGQTWPVLLIVLGALALAGGSSRRNSPQEPSMGEPYPQAPGVPPFVRPDAPPPPPGVRR
jgi:hypothetical protein